MSKIQQLHHTAQLLINRRDYEAAHQTCVEILQQVPDYADAYFLLGVINSELGQVNKAIRLMNKAIEIAPQTEYQAYLCKCLTLIGDLQRAAEVATQISPEQSDNAGVLDTMGVSLSRIGLHQQALHYFRKALQQPNPSPGLYYNYAVSLKFSGEFTQAKQAFEQAISLKPDYFQAHFALADIGGQTKQNNHINRLKALWNETLSCSNMLHLGHALAKEYEALGDYDAAFKSLLAAKEHRAKELNYHFKAQQPLFDFARQVLPAEQSGGSQSERPIFVMGMPRSGTTLVERIISSHTDVTSGGELQDFGFAVKQLTQTPSLTVLDEETLQQAACVPAARIAQTYLERTNRIGGGSRHFVDKLPFNFFYLPLIRRAFPTAKIVCLLRDPMDTCIGNFRQLFTINSPYYAYANSLMDTGRFYAAFAKVASFWAEQNDDNFYLLEYEQLVSDPQRKIPQLISFCELDWQEQCLHAEQNPAPVSTASKVQVREPVNTSSIGRWKRYRPHTDRLEAYFKSLTAET